MMNISLTALIWILPFAFALHNLEEVFGMEKWSKTIHSYIHRPVTTKQFGIAVTLFTLLVFLLVFTKGIYPSEKVYYFAITGFSGMLFLNVFFPHLLATLYLRKYAPGIITGLLLNLPLTGLILIKIKQMNILTVEQIICTSIAGGVIGAFLAWLFLRIGNGLKKVIK